MGTSEVFDPADHTAADVAAHLDEHPDELDRVLNAEAAGKARKTVLVDIEKRLASEYQTPTLKAGDHVRYDGEVEQHFPFLRYVDKEGEERTGIVLEPGDRVVLAEDASHGRLSPVKE